MTQKNNKKNAKSLMFTIFEIGKKFFTQIGT
jgi:hypothetical protein